MKYEKLFKAYKFFIIIIMSLYKQFICKRQVTQSIRKCTEAYLIFSPKMRRLFEGGA